jgi:hypothetical protein
MFLFMIWSSPIYKYHLLFVMSSEIHYVGLNRNNADSYGHCFCIILPLMF